MREDFHKVIVEKARSGSWMRGHRTRWSVRSYDADCEYAIPGRESSSSDWYPDHKFFSDRLGPLKRYLAKQIGRPWRKLEGELRKALDLRTVMGRHLWDHVLCEVEQRVRIGEDRRPVRLDGRNIRNLYVHPRTGLLLRPKPERIDSFRARQERIADTEKIVLDRTTTAEKKGDLWFLLIDTGRTEEVVDIRNDRNGRTITLRHTRPVIRKKQANTDEIRCIRAALEAAVE